MLTVGVAAMGLALLVVPQTRADGHRGGSYGGYRYGSGHHFDYRFPSHGYHASHRFGYDRFGYRSLSYSSYRWSYDHRCYIYWAPSYRCWFFYEPTYSYYVPVTYYRQVYPEFTAPVATVPPPSSAIQQTSVIVTPSAPVGVVGTAPGPVGPPAGIATPTPIPPVATAPAAVQNTKVNNGTP
jgi:hypothetical protein